MNKLLKPSVLLLTLFSPLALTSCVEGGGYYGGYGYYDQRYYDGYDRQYYRDRYHRHGSRYDDRDHRPYTRADNPTNYDRNGGRWRTESNGQRIWIPGTGR